MVCKPYLNKTAKKPKSLKPILCLASDCQGPGRLSVGMRTGWGGRGGERALRLRTSISLTPWILAERCRAWHLEDAHKCVDDILSFR